MRIILFTGKGGVGKTSVAAATSLSSAKRGYRTIILSTDAAHSLSDSFDLPLGNEPQPIAPNLSFLSFWRDFKFRVPSWSKAD